MENKHGLSTRFFCDCGLFDLLMIGGFITFVIVNKDYA